MPESPDLLGHAAHTTAEKVSSERQRNKRFTRTPESDIVLHDPHLDILWVVSSFYTASIYHLTKLLHLHGYIALTTNSLSPQESQRRWENLVYQTSELARTLWRLEYLEKLRVPSRHEDVFGVGPRAIYPLQKYRGVKRRDIKTFAMSKGYSLGHEMMAGHFRTAASVAMTASALRVGSWQRKPRLQTGAWWKEPDYEWIVPQSTSPATCFVEIDKGTESIIGNDHDIVEKLEFYSSYYQHEWEGVIFTPEGKQKGFRVLFVTTSPRRVQSMIAAVKTLDPKRWGMFWFCHERPYILNYRRVFDRIWSTARHEKPQVLF